MKYFALLLALFCSLHLHAHMQYEQIIELQAQEWKKSYLETLTNPQQIQTLIDVILLSYQIAQQSCIMILAKLTIQEELLKLYTPSLNDSWHTNLQVIHNDTSKLEQSVEIIKQSQATFQKIFSKLKSVGPRIVQINPQPTQTLITDLKHSLMIWCKQQHEFSSQLDMVQREFSLAITTISDIKIMFETMVHAPELKHSYLKEAAGYVAKTNKDIESVFAHITQIRKTSVVKIQSFFDTFFQTYYSMLYNLLTPEQQTALTTLACEDEKLPLPDAFFT